VTTHATSREVLMVRVKPNAKHDEILGMRAGALEVRVAAPPVDGAANARVLRIIARHYNLPLSAVHLLGGGKSRLKRIVLTGKPR